MAVDVQIGRLKYSKTLLADKRNAVTLDINEKCLQSVWCQSTGIVSLRGVISKDSVASAGSGAAQVSLSLGAHQCQTAVHCHSGTKGKKKKLSRQFETNQSLH